MESSTFGHVSDWDEVIKKEARGRDNADLGEVQEVNENFVVTERGTLNKERFYLSKSIPHGYNGHTLLFDITEEEAKEKFMRDPNASIFKSRYRKPYSRYRRKIRGVKKRIGRRSNTDKRAIEGNQDSRSRVNT